MTLQAKSQRGAALIIVIGLVALISTWAIDAIYADNIALRRAENNNDALHARQASLSALMLTAKILKEDSATSQSDDLDEIWAQAAEAFPIDDGLVMGSIIDSNRYINLNDLVNAQGQANPVVETYVKALFIQLEIDEGLVDALIDWMDADAQQHGSNGAEDSSYYDKDYHVHNARLDDWNELFLIRGFDAKIIAKLAKGATVHPVAQGGISTVNINTAPAVVLMALAPKMTKTDAEILIGERPFASVGQALQQRTWGTGLNLAYLSVISNIFMVQTQANFGRAVLRETCMLQRNSGTITLLSIQRSRHLIPTAIK